VQSTAISGEPVNW